MWCCGNSSCPPDVRSYAISLSFSRTVLRNISTWGNQLFPHNFAKCWAISKILLKTDCNEVMVKVPPDAKHTATLRCDVSLIKIYVSGCFCFSDINTSQGSVATHLRCGGIFNYCFGRNLLLSLSLEPQAEICKKNSRWLVTDFSRYPD